MRTPRSILPFAVLALALLAACRPRESTSQSIASDLHSYMQELQKWEPKEKEIFGALEDVERSQYVDDDYVVRTLKSALPALDEHIRVAATYRPLTPEVLDVHEHYKKGYDDMKASMQQVINALTSKNYVELASAKGNMKKAYTDVLKAFRALDIMLSEHEGELKQLEKS
jgi:hypothetical protein